MSDFKIVFVHGYTASSKADWYPNLTKELDALHVDYVVPDLPCGKHPHAKDWLEIVDREVRNAGKPVALVGHSLGSRTVLLYLDQFKQPVKMVFLIAAFANWTENAKRRDENYADFFEHKLDIDAIKKLCNKFVVIHSRDDDSIDYKQGQEIAEDLGAKLVTADGRGHMYKPSNSPLILEQLRQGLGF